jgi:ubiquinone biosynthesis protein
MRSLQIVWILSKYLILYKLTRYRKEIFGQRLKLAFEDLGITFIKIGQILSMRYDLLSEKDCQALQGLLDNVNPIPYETIVAILEREYSKPLGQIFRDFEEKPLGSASVSQVHKAKLFDGSMVAVKVKRPQVDNKFFYDIRILRRLARTAELCSRTLRHVQIREMMDYFEAWIKQDLDFVHEVYNMQRYKEEYGFAESKFRSDLGRQIIPRAFENFCTQNIIVMDYIEGIPLNRARQMVDDSKYDIQNSVKLAVNVPIRYWFGREQAVYIYQADPHLSNILALPNGDVANIDFGLIAEISLEEAGLCRDLVLAVYLKDIDKVLHLVANVSHVKPAKLTPDVRADFEDYLIKAQKSGFGYWFMEFAKIMVKHRLKFPLFMTTFGRGYVMTDGMINTYLPGQTTLDIVGVELRRLAFQQATKNILNADWTKLAYVVSEQIRKTPDIVTEFFDDPLTVIAKVARATKGAI